MPRKLKNNITVPEYHHTIELGITTHAPQKYRVVDMETGQVWAPLVTLNNGTFVRWERDLTLERKVFTDIKQEANRPKVIELLITFFVLITIFASLHFLPPPWGAEINATVFYFFLQYAITSLLCVVAYRLGTLWGDES
jgi:hypothetical protein